MTTMNLKKFDTLTRRDFENGAILDEIRATLKQHEDDRKNIKWIISNHLNGFVGVDQALVEINNIIEGVR